MVSRKRIRKIILKFNTNQNDIVQVKVGLSTVSIEGAKLALEKENPGWNFESVKEQAQSKWKKLLSRVQVQGTPEQKQHFIRPYTICIPNLMTLQM